MAYFPAFIDITKKRCLVVGGGKVAARKVETLLRYGADVEVFAEVICSRIRELLPEEKLHEGKLSDEKLHEETLPDEKLPEGKLSDERGEALWAELLSVLSAAALVVAATSSRTQNHRIYELCVVAGRPVNVADSLAESSFVFPAVVKKGEISVGINSGTGSPALSRELRERIERAIPDAYADIALWMGALREQVKAHFPEERQRRWIIQTAAAKAFSEERVLTQEEIKDIVRRSEDDSVSGRPVGY